MGKGRLVVVDLDGTLVKCNTLHLYLSLGIGMLLSQHKYSTTLKLFGLSFLRALGLISHKKFKYESLALISPNTELKQKFQEEINAKINPAVIKILKEMQNEGMTVLLATAATDLYIPWIWKGDFIASDISNNIDMRGEQKLEAVKHYMKVNNLELYAVITDHFDDLPLLKAGAKRNILVNPSRITRRLCDVEYEII